MLLVLMVSSISVLQARKKALTSFGIFHYETPSRNHFNTQMCATSWLHRWLRDPWVYLPDLDANKERTGLVWHTSSPKSKEDIHCPGQASGLRASWQQACRDLSQIGPAGGFERGDWTVGYLPHTQANLRTVSPARRTFKPSYSPGLGSYVSQALSEKPELLNPEIEECWRGRETGGWGDGAWRRSKLETKAFFLAAGFFLFAKLD